MCAAATPLAYPLVKVLFKLCKSLVCLLLFEIRFVPRPLHSEAVPLTERVHVPSYMLSGEELTECQSDGTSKDTQWL